MIPTILVDTLPREVWNHNNHTIFNSDSVLCSNSMLYKWLRN